MAAALFLVIGITFGFCRPLSLSFGGYTVSLRCAASEAMAAGVALASSLALVIERCGSRVRRHGEDGSGDRSDGRARERDLAVASASLPAVHGWVCEVGDIGGRGRW